MPGRHGRFGRDEVNALDVMTGHDRVGPPSTEDLHERKRRAAGLMRLDGVETVSISDPTPAERARLAEQGIDVDPELEKFGRLVAAGYPTIPLNEELDRLRSQFGTGDVEGDSGIVET